MNDSINGTTYFAEADTQQNMLLSTRDGTTHASLEDNGFNPLTAIGLAAIAVTVLMFFVLALPLWAMGILGVLAVLSHSLQKLRALAGVSKVLFVYCALVFVINNFGIAYPYTNILVLTGLLALFFFSGMNWRDMYFAPGKTGQWGRNAMLAGVAIAALVLSLHFVKPGILGQNPTPREWPIDVVLVVAIGYAIFSALMEETIFRSVIMAYTRPQLGGTIAVVLQALVFGTMHYRAGFPSQTLGACGSFLWGLVAGWMVLRAESVYPAYLMHFIAVLLMFVGLAFVEV